MLDELLFILELFFNYILFSVPTAQKPPTSVLSGSGHVLGSSAGQPLTSSKITSHDKIRSVWSTRFSSTKTSTIKLPTETKQSNPDLTKNNMQGPSKIPSPTKTWKELDNDILIQEIHHDVINISDNESDDAVHMPNVPEQKRSITIKQELIDDLGDNDSVIELIDDEYNDDLNNESFEILSDTSVIDDIFGSDTLMSDFKQINDVIMKDPENRGKPNKEIITCPICQEQMPREQLSDHLDGCTGIAVKVEKRKTRNARILSPHEISTLRAAGYNQSAIESAEEKTYNARIFGEMRAEKRNSLGGAPKQPMANILNSESGRENSFEQLDCPNCGKNVVPNDINDHLDVCLQSETPATEQNPPRAAEMVQCPICNQKVQVDQINEHVDDCLGPSFF